MVKNFAVIFNAYESIFCDCCNKWLHKCSFRQKETFKILCNSNDPFFFFSDYDENSISCITLDSTKIQKSFVTPPEKLVYLK